MTKPLEGIRVIELSTYVAAPVTARLLADLGAQVIKVEHPKGDTWRVTGQSFLPHYYTPEENPVFDIYNSGKQHIALNLKAPEGMEVFHKLLASADVFITNTRPAALKRLGLSYDDLKETYPKLVYSIVLGYGENGPDAEMPAFDTSAFWARSGFLQDLSLKKEDFTPVEPPYSMGDTVTGYLLMGEICAALFRRSQTGKGDYVRSSLFHNGIFTTGTMSLIAQKPHGRAYPNTRASFGANSGDFRCSDGQWVFLSGYSPERYPVFYEMIGRPELSTDPRFATAQARRENAALLYEIVRDAMLTNTAEYWLQKAKTCDLPMVRMKHFSEVSEDQQAWANGYLEHVTFRNGREGVMPSSPIEMDSVGTVTTKSAPAIGADTEKLLAELGYSEDEIQKMLQSGAAK